MCAASGRLPEPEARQDESKERLAAVPGDIPQNGKSVSVAAPAPRRALRAAVPVPITAP